LSADEVMASILHLAHSMDEDDAPDTTLPTSHHLPSPPLSLMARLTQRSRPPSTWSSRWSRTTQQVQRLRQPRPHLFLLHCPG
jgi:hypothetical protein